MKITDCFLFKTFKACAGGSHAAGPSRILQWSVSGPSGWTTLNSEVVGLGSRSTVRGGRGNWTVHKDWLFMTVQIRPSANRVHFWMVGTTGRRTSSNRINPMIPDFVHWAKTSTYACSTNFHFFVLFFYFKSGWIKIEWTQNPWSWTVTIFVSDLCWRSFGDDRLWWSQGYCYIIQCILNNICTVLRNFFIFFWHFFFVHTILVRSRCPRTRTSLVLLPSCCWWGYVWMALKFVCPQTILVGKCQRTYLTSPTMKTHMRVQVPLINKIKMKETS